MNRSARRRLDHRGEEYPKTVDDGKRAQKDENGNCIVYKESQADHFWRIGYHFVPEGTPQIVDPYEDLTIDESLKMYGLVMQGNYGDNTAEKPWFWEIENLFLWQAWEDLKGMSLRNARAKFIKEAERVLKKLKYEEYIQNPDAPGPNYYDDCNQEEMVVIKEEPPQALNFAQSKEAEKLSSG